MKKFIYGCLLLSFLYILLYVTPCYAFSKTDIQNLTYNYVINNDNITNKDLWIETIDNFDYSSILSSSSSQPNNDFSEFFDNDRYKLACLRKSSTNNALYFYVVDSYAEKPIMSALPTNNGYTRIYISNRGSFNIGYTSSSGVCSWKSTLRETTSNHETTSLYQYTLYTDQDIWQSGSENNTIIQTAPYSNPIWLVPTGPYTEEQQEFTFYINELATTQYVDLLTDNGIGGIYTFENVPVLYSSNNFGYLVDTLENHVLESDALGFYYLSGSR